MMSDNNFVFGIHAVQSLLRNHPEKVIRLMILNGRHDRRLEKLLKDSHGIERSYLKRAKLDELVSGENHQGVVAQCLVSMEKSLHWDEEKLLSTIEQQQAPALILVLDGITDPHNLGACLRTADAAGALAVLSAKDKSVGITPVVSKVACGAAETVPFVQVTNLVRSLKKLQQLGVWVIGTSGDAKQSIYQAKLTGAIALVMGSEGKGMRRLTTDTCDELIKIPMAGQVSSLNVSVATGVTLFEIVRQRNL